jgi:hypothetical protein
VSNFLFEALQDQAWNQDRAYIYEQLEQITGAKVYFANPYSSWKRGFNEYKWINQKFLSKEN